MWGFEQQSLYNLMQDVIDNDLKFNSADDKATWMNERGQWRLPYWNWAVNTNVPTLFTTETVALRVPLGPDGQPGKPDVKRNPLFRYQVQVDGQPVKMGDLDAPYKVDNVYKSDDPGKPPQLVFPVSAPLIWQWISRMTHYV